MSRYSLNSSFENVKISYQNIPPLTLSPFLFTYFLFIWSNIIHSQYLEIFFFDLFVDLCLQQAADHWAHLMLWNL